MHSCEQNCLCSLALCKCGTQPNLTTCMRPEPTNYVFVSNTSHTSRVTTGPHESCNQGKNRGITSPDTSRTTTPHTCRATTHHTRPHRNGTATCVTRNRAERVKVRTLAASRRPEKKSNNEDHCTRQRHIIHQQAKEKGTPGRGDRCSRQTRCTQTQNVRTLPSSVNDSTLPLTPLTLQLTPLTPLTPLTQIFHLRVKPHRTDAHQSRRVRSCAGPFCIPRLCGAVLFLGMQCGPALVHLLICYT